jgi:hypothetical protein
MKSRQGAGRPELVEARGGVFQQAVKGLGVGVGTAWFFLAAAAVHGDGYDPYRIPQEQFGREVRVVALQPVQVPVDLQGADDVRRRFEKLVRFKLESKGYKIVDPAVVEQQWVAMSQKVGGVFDPVTGKADEAKAKAVREHSARALERDHEIDAFLVVRIAYDSMDAWTGQAGFLWRTLGEPLTWKGKNLGDMPQRVVGVFLNIAFFDLAGDVLYSIRAPIQWTMVFAARSYDERPRAELFADERNRQAVELTLDPLIGAGS